MKKEFQFSEHSWVNETFMKIKLVAFKLHVGF